MTAKAMNSTGWRVRLGGMAAMFAGFCAFFLYDGFVGYPKQQTIYAQFVAFVCETNNIKLPAEQSSPTHEEFMSLVTNQSGKAGHVIYEQWDDHAAEQNLPPSGKDGKEIKAMAKTDSSILWQKILGFVLLPVSALMIRAWFQTFSRWVAVDDAGVTTSTGQKAPWNSMKKLDKLRWPKKGIAFLHYDDPDKQIEQKILLDDFKFDRLATEQIVRAIEAHLKDDQIVGDIRETERDRRKAERAAAEKVAATGTPAAGTPPPQA